MGFGDYPIEYNQKVHGPYDPARYYGKPDTPLNQVKLGELGAWFGRRNKTPHAMVAACSRAWWRWQHKFIQGKNPGPAGILHVFVGAMILGYAVNYPRMQFHVAKKYH